MSDAVGISSAAIAPKRRSRLSDFFIRLVREKPLGTISGIIVLIMVLVAIFADSLAPFPYDEVNILDRMQGPSAEYLLGTDQLGRDLLSRLIVGARVSLTVGLAATALNVLIAVLIGGISGFIGGKLDLGVQRFVDAWMAFPGLLLLLTIMSIVGRGLLQVIVILGIAGGIGASRIVRGAVIGIKENDYFLAARSIGSPGASTLMRHVLPNIMPVVIIIFSISIGGVIIAAASLSFLGYGLPATIPDWGGMLSREGRQYMEMAPRLALWPGLCLTITVYSLNMFGDALRDLLDPRLRAANRRACPIPRYGGRVSNPPALSLSKGHSGGACMSVGALREAPTPARDLSDLLRLHLCPFAPFVGKPYPKRVTPLSALYPSISQPLTGGKCDITPTSRHGGRLHAVADQIPSPLMGEG